MKTLLLISFIALSCLKTDSATDKPLKLQHSVYKANLAKQCNDTTGVYDVIYRTFNCFSLWQHIATVKSQACTSYRYNNKRNDTIGMKEPMQRAVFQYCNGTTNIKKCFKCFNDAVDHIWYRNPCKMEFDWEKVTGCMGKFDNPKFRWSKNVSIWDYSKVVYINQNSYPYKLCKDTFDNLGIRSNFEVSFPLRMPRFRKEEEKEFNVLLSLFINTFENNNPDGETLSAEGFRCQDFIKGGYLSRYYHEVLEWVVNPNDKDIENAYEAVRQDMCEITKKKEECAACYREGDEMFISYLGNKNSEVQSIIDNFTTIYNIYESCHRKSNVSQEYKNILWSPHFGLEKVSMTSCSRVLKIYYDEFMAHRNDNTMTGEKKAIDFRNNLDKVFKTVYFNSYSLFGYALRHPRNDSCSLLAEKSLACMLRYADFETERLKDVTTPSEAEDSIIQFTSMLAEGCPDMTWK